jgi:hypothetical protein
LSVAAAAAETATTAFAAADTTHRVNSKFFFVGSRFVVSLTTSVSPPPAR